MIFVVLISRRFGINPDNVATPVAASLGDITTLVLLSGVAELLFYGKSQLLTNVNLHSSCIIADALISVSVT